jgi:hypothetical protein
MAQTAMSTASFKTFLSAGKAIFTIQSHKTGTRFTYRVRMSKDQRVFFVSVLTGADNTSAYTFIGTLKPGVGYVHSHKSPIGPDAPSAVAFAWLWRNLKTGVDVAAKADLYHEGKCGRCGRCLTVPESIKTGLGPDCAALMSAAAAQVKAERAARPMAIAA